MSRPPLGSTLHILGLSLPYYSLLMMAAVALAIALSAREERRLGLPTDTILNFSLWAIPFGVVGARLYYVAFTFSRYRQDPLEIFRVWNGGLAIYGAVLGGLLVAIVYTRKKGIPLTALLDALAPALALGQAIGRWGNYANMEAYGARIYDPALQFFPFAVEIRLLGANGTEYWYWHMATFFYEFVLCFVIFLILMARRRHMRRSGDVIAWYLLIYGAGRTVIEGLRDDSLLLNVAAAQVRISQIASALLCLGVLILFFVRLIKQYKIRFTELLCWGGILLGLACAFVSEFERNAYQSLFAVAQGLLGGLLFVDFLFLFHYLGRVRKLYVPALSALLLMGFGGFTLSLGIGLMGNGNAAYIALRQLAAMLHVVFCGGWFYLKGSALRRRKIRRLIPDDSPRVRPIPPQESENT